ncbi:Uncharacterised protein [Bordetella ansorpii]|uniref:Uncharacterized protein n=1 Tax=Bordetella ansorpii TaxID=288768 RepID=A0A157MD67_9BORD|nr:hypothetical protein [Bordetella ansorpii]SAI06736.1 Uncharacterised protein [Bordetella ansorpii]
MKPTSSSKQANRNDDLARQDQASHHDAQNRSKKDGHATNLGTGQDQQSMRNRGQGARRS